MTPDDVATWTTPVGDQFTTWPATTRTRSLAATGEKPLTGLGLDPLRPAAPLRLGPGLARRRGRDTH